MRRIMSALALAGGLASGPSLAQQNSDPLVATAREWGGADGVYTCEQWRAYMKKLYRLADPKKRGYIDEKSFAIIPRTSSVFASATFDYFDQAGKGRVTQQEFVEFESPFFARFDKKHSCRVTNEDIRAASAPAQGPQQRMGPGAPHGAAGGLGGGFGWRQ